MNQEQIDKLNQAKQLIDDALSLVNANQPADAVDPLTTGQPIANPEPNNGAGVQPGDLDPTESGADGVTVGATRIPVKDGTEDEAQPAVSPESLANPPAGLDLGGADGLKAPATGDSEASADSSAGSEGSSQPAAGL